MTSEDVFFEILMEMVEEYQATEDEAIKQRIIDFIKNPNI